jgi:hypothetical protein
MSRGSLKESLKQEVLAQVEAFGVWKQKEAKTTFEEIEAKALEMGQAIMRAMISFGVADEQQLERQSRSEAEPRCAECGQPMRYGGQPAKTVKSKVGDIQMDRDYYHCPGCGEGLFPPG